MSGNASRTRGKIYGWLRWRLHLLTREGRRQDRVLRTPEVQEAFRWAARDFEEWKRTL